MAATLITLIVLLLHLVHGAPAGSTDVDPAVVTNVNNLIKNEKWEDLCKFQTQVESLKHYLMAQRRVKKILFKGLDKTLDYLKNKTERYPAYDCPTLVFTTLVKSTTTTEAVPFGENLNENLNEQATGTENPQYVELCDDCKIDYNEIDEVREDFNKVLVEGKQTEMSTKNLIILVTTGIFGAILVGLFIFLCIKVCSC